MAPDLAPVVPYTLSSSAPVVHRAGHAPTVWRDMLQAESNPPSGRPLELGRRAPDGGLTIAPAASDNRRVGTSRQPARNRATMAQDARSAGRAGQSRDGARSSRKSARSGPARIDGLIGRWDKPMYTVYWHNGNVTGTMHFSRWGAMWAMIGSFRDEVRFRVVRGLGV